MFGRAYCTHQYFSFIAEIRGIFYLRIFSRHYSPLLRNHFFFSAQNLPYSATISRSNVQTAKSSGLDEAGAETVKKGLCPFLTKGLQSAARTICTPLAYKSHTCSLIGIFCQVHAPTENDQNPFAACGRQTLRGFFDTLSSGLDEAGAFWGSFYSSVRSNLPRGRRR